MRSSGATAVLDTMPAIPDDDGHTTDKVAQCDRLTAGCERLDQQDVAFTQRDHLRLLARDRHSDRFASLTSSPQKLN